MTAIDLPRLHKQVTEALRLAESAPEDVRAATRDALTMTCPNAKGRTLDFGVQMVCIKGRLSLDGQGHVPDERCEGTGRVPRQFVPDPTEQAEVAAWLGRLSMVVWARRPGLPVPQLLLFIKFQNCLSRGDLTAAMDALCDCLRHLAEARAG